MADIKKLEPIFFWKKVTLIENFDTVLYPIDISVLLRKLPKLGYIVPYKLLKGVLEPGEALAKKGDNEVIIHQDRGNFGIAGIEVKPTIESFVELVDFVKNQLKPSDMTFDFYEMTGEGLLATPSNPISAFSKFWSESEHIKKLKEKSKLDLTNFGFRLVSNNIEPNSKSWFDLRIQPNVISSSNEYYINLVWRQTESIDCYKEIEQLIYNLIKEVEK